MGRVNQAVLTMQVAAAEHRYLEKINGNIPALFHKSDNAGTRNWTKYWHDLSRSLQSQPWCAAWTSWCCWVAGVPTSVVPILFSCTAIRDWAQARGLWHLRAGFTPRLGDHVIFLNSAGNIAHIGLVERVTDTQIHTIEGNTSAGSESVVANGGGVFRRTYNRSNVRILGYFRPNYADVTFSNDSPFLTEGSRGPAVGDLQRLLIKHGYTLDDDNSMGPITRGALDDWKRKNNYRIDGVVDEDTWDRLRNKQSATTSPSIEKVDYTVEIITRVNPLNVRATPGAPGPIIIGTVARGSIQTIARESHGPGAALWGQLPSGGWISLDLTRKVYAPAPAPAPATFRVRVNTQSSPLNIRTGPSIDHARVTVNNVPQQLDRNSVHTIVEVSNNWGRLTQKFNGRAGWISMDFAVKI